MERISRKPANFVFPRLREELGEIERVAEYVGESKAQFVPRFLQATLRDSNRTQFVELTNSIWDQLKNTDSTRIGKGDWKSVSEACENKRDWEKVRREVENGTRLDAPIIVRLPNEYHLVSGNTRLMCSKALGVVPKVLIVDMT
jgi:hypothetical protein